MTATGLERRVRQHDNDISAVYTMIADIQNTQRRHTNRFNELTEDVAVLGERMASLGTGVTSLESKMTSLGTTMASPEGRVDRILGLLQR